MSSPRIFSKPFARVGLILLGLSLVLFNWLYPLLRIDFQPANQVFFALACFTPWVAVSFAREIASKWLRVTAVATSAGLGILLLPLAILAGLIAFLPPTWARIATINTGRHSVSVYETNCGAPCDFGIAVRQEWRPFYGLLIVRNLPGFYPAHSPSYQVLGLETFQISVPAYGGAPERSRVYALRRLP